MRVFFLYYEWKIGIDYETCVECGITFPDTIEYEFCFICNDYYC